MRDISHVIEELRHYIVAENIVFNSDLDNIAESVMYTAPEEMYLRWEQLADIVNYVVGGIPFDATNKNKANIIAIFCDIPVEVAIERHGIYPN